MPESEQSNQNEFLIEKFKERPVNRKKLLRRTIITAAMAVIFGLIACFTFLLLEPVINNWLYPEEPPQIVVFPEDQEEMSPEEMLSDNMQAENGEETPPEQITIPEEQIQEILAGLVLNRENYRQLYTALSNFVSELHQSIVTVTGVSSDRDWLNNVMESSGQSSGVIVADNGRELLILADYGPISDAEKLTLTFHNNVQAQAQVKQLDPSTNLAVLSVDQEALPADMSKESIKIAELGSSNVKNIVSMPVVALGSPMGIGGSVAYGIITSAGGQISVVDANYKLLVTDIYGSKYAGGALFNLQGQVVGIITGHKESQDMENIVTAYGISEMKKMIARMSNGTAMVYLGVCGVDVTREANEELKVPYGAYVTEVAMDSPAMLAGIQKGDVIVGMNGETVLNFSEFSSLLMEADAGQVVDFTVMRQVQKEYKEMSFNITLEEIKRK